MAQWVAITFAVIVFVAASMSLALRWDVLLFVLRPKFSLRTLLILLAILPPLLAAGWFAWPSVQKWLAPAVAPSPFGFAVDR